MTAQWRSILFWVGAIVIMILATLFYQPAAAKTGSLLVWTRGRVYVMDIDTLDLQRVAPAHASQTIAPSPGCFRQMDLSCWVLVDAELYFVDLTLGGSHAQQTALPIEAGYQWAEGTMSWAPDGLHVAYSVVNEAQNQIELRIYSVVQRTVAHTFANVDPAVAAAWTAGCAAGLAAFNCEIGYLQNVATEPPILKGFSPASGVTRSWPISHGEVFELRWSPDDVLLYSRPKRHFINPETDQPAYDLPLGGQLANMSPDTRHVVYYHPFTLEGCQTDADGCLQLGVWLTHPPESGQKSGLIYHVEVDESGQPPGLNFIPVWSSTGNAFVFFQQGQLIYYDLDTSEGTIWHKTITGKLRSVPVFSPNEEAVAFVDDEGQGLSEHRLVVVNPRLQPVENIIEAAGGFQILAWLPN